MFTPQSLLKLVKTHRSFPFCDRLGPYGCSHAAHIPHQNQKNSFYSDRRGAEPLVRRFLEDLPQACVANYLNSLSAGLHQGCSLRKSISPRSAPTPPPHPLQFCILHREASRLNAIEFGVRSIQCQRSEFRLFSAAPEVVKGLVGQELIARSG